MSNLDIPTARVFAPLLAPARYKGAHGGRGSGKSHFFAGLLVEDSLRYPGEHQGEGLRSVCVREVQRDLKESAKLLIEDKLAEFRLGEADGFKSFTDRIQTPGDGQIIFRGMQDYNAESIKSLEAFRRAWIEEAQTLTTRSLTLLRPTLRAAGSEIWASWNPRRKSDAIDEFLRGQALPGAVVVQANWKDNPWFPAVLDEERRLDMHRYPERYPHIWDGDYARAAEGAYFATQLSIARAEGRIGAVGADPLLPIRLYWDIGGAGDNADAMSIWAVQFVGHSIRVLSYIEGQGQVLAYYVNELRSRGYEKAKCYLPHDGVNANIVTGKRFQDHLTDAGFDTTVIQNQGKGAAMMRIEAVRRILSQCWFNEATTSPGIDALGFYHERRDEHREVGLGPDHDWSSHCADAFGLMAVDYEDPGKRKAFNRPLVFPKLGVA